MGLPRFPCWVKAAFTSLAGSVGCIANLCALRMTTSTNGFRHAIGKARTNALPTSVPTTTSTCNWHPTPSMDDADKADMWRLLSRQWTCPVACLAALKPSVHCRWTMVASVRRPCRVPCHTLTIHPLQMDDGRASEPALSRALLHSNHPPTVDGQ